MRKSTNGFTIVELLIVIVVITILATISVVSYNNFRSRSQATAIIADLEATSTALRAYKTFSGGGNWWLDTDPALTGSTSDNPNITSIINAQPEFRELLKKSPSKIGLDTSQGWFYDYDGDTYSGCGGTRYAGVNLQIFNVNNASMMQLMDDIADDGDLACGNVRTSSNGSTTFVYGISNGN